MRPLLSYLVPIYWIVAFAIMASHAAALPSGLTIDGASIGFLGSSPAGEGLRTSLAIAAGVVATLFLWSFLTAVMAGGDQPGAYEEVASVAFGAAVLVLTSDLVLSALSDQAHALRDSPYQLTALLASYAAVIFERRMWVRPRRADDVRTTARRMALGAAHSSMLSRISGPARGGAE